MLVSWDPVVGQQIFETGIAGNNGLAWISVRPQFLQAGRQRTLYLTRTRVICGALEARLAPAFMQYPETKQPEPAIHQDDHREHRIAGGRRLDLLHQGVRAREEFLRHAYLQAQVCEELGYLCTMAHEPDETQKHQRQRPQGTDQRLPGGFNGLGLAFLVERQPPALAEGRQERATDAEHDDDGHDDIERRG